MPSKTALLFIAAYVGFLLMAVVHPIYPMIAYLIDYYQHPPLRWWGDALPRGMRWSLVASVVWLGSVAMHGRGPLGAAVRRAPQTKWLIGFLLIALCVTPIAVDVARSMHYLDILFRLVLLYLLIVSTVSERKHFQWIVLVMVIGGLTWGWDAFRDPDRVAGRLKGIGGPDSVSDNAAAAHLLTALPFVVALLFTGTRWMKAAALAAAPLIVNAIILCNSRGATIAIGAMAVSAVVLAPGKMRSRLAGLVLAGGVVGVMLSDPQFLERQVTILAGTDELDNSANSRLESWKGALELMVDYPLGAGGGGFDILSPRYIPEIVAQYDGAERAVHNTYLWVGSDWGWLGLATFLAYLGATLRQARQVFRDAADRFVVYNALALQVSLVGFMVAGFFINRPYAEAFYWLPALCGALWTINVEERVPEAVRGSEGAPIVAAAQSHA